MDPPKLVEGTLYIDRDQDTKTGEWGPYVKIGIVRENKTPEERVRQLQTGNPRKVHTIKTYFSPMVESLETRLHHNFAERWVRGEWFEMDEEFVNNSLDAKINEYIAEQNRYKEFFEQRETLKTTASNGVIRDATEDEIKLHSEYCEQKKIHDQMNAKSSILKYKLLKAMGSSGGVNTILQVKENITEEKYTPEKIKFDKKKFKAEYPNEYAEFVTITYSDPKGTLSMKKLPTLAKINPDLKNEKKEVDEEVKKLKVELAGKDTIEPTQEIKDIHAEYVSILGDIFNSGLQMERIKSQLTSLLGDSEGIKDVVVWKRVSKEKENFDQKGAEEKYPDSFNTCMVTEPEKTTPGKVVVSVNVEMYREYPL